MARPSIHLLWFSVTIVIAKSNGLVLEMESLQFSKQLKHHVLLTKYGVSLRGCVEMCDARAKCKSLNYSKRIKMCLLNTKDSGEVKPIRSPGFVYYEDPAWIQSAKRCGSDDCNGNEACDVKSQECHIKECVSPSHDVHGNTFSVHDKLLLRCGALKVPSTCSNTGVWSNKCPETCREVMDISPLHGNYELYDVTSGKFVSVYCDFRDGHGYTYVAPDSLASVSDLSRHYTRNGHVMVRHMRSDNSQWEATVAVLQRYRHLYNVSILLTNYNYFQTPWINPTGPYIYLGFVPVSFGNVKNTSQGYAVNDHDFTFNNCDGNANNYFVVFSNIADSSLTQGFVGSLMRAWIDAATVCDKEIPTEFFYVYFEMHMGGCGGKAYNSDAKGVTFGLRFDY